MENFKNLLNADEIEILIDSPFPNDKANLLSQKLKDIVIIQDKMLYVLQPNLTYSVSNTDIHSNLLTVCTALIAQSFKALAKTDSAMLEMKHKKTLAGIFQNAAVEKYYPQLLQPLTRTDMVFDDYLCIMNFNNGYMDFEDLKFKPRTVGKHYISKYIHRDYVASTKTDQDIVLSHVRKIYPDQEDLNCITSILGSALSGKSTNDQDILFLLGEGSSGKSFILEITGLTIDCYFKELKDDTFCQQNSKIDKIMNSFTSNPQIRITWINEPKDQKFDSSVLKNFCDGKIQTTILYEDDSHTVYHYSKPILTANVLPNVQFDSGINRRIKGFTHGSDFTDGIRKKVDESKHIYLLDKQLKDKMKQGNLLNAWFDILASQCHLWLKGKQIKYTPNFTETKDTVVLSNDIFQDFIDTHLEISTDAAAADARISKEDMLNTFREMYPKSFLTLRQIITSLKTKNILYECKFRSKNQKTQGCFVGVSFQDAPLTQNSPLDYGVRQENTYKTMYEDAMKRIKELEAQLNPQPIHESIQDLEAELDSLSNKSDEEIVEVKPKSIKKMAQTADELDAEIEQALKPTATKSKKKNIVITNHATKVVEGTMEDLVNDLLNF